MIAVWPYSQCSAATPACSRMMERAPSAATTSLASISKASPPRSMPSVRRSFASPVAGDPRRCECLDAGHAAQPLPEGRADHAVGQHVAERVQPLLGCVDPRDAEAALLGDVDAADRGRLALHVAPDVEAAEHPHACRWPVPSCARRSSGAPRSRAPRPRRARPAARAARVPARATRRPGRRRQWRRRTPAVVRVSCHEPSRSGLTSASRARSRQVCAAARR